MPVYRQLAMELSHRIAQCYTGTTISVFMDRQIHSAVMHADFFAHNRAAQAKGNSVATQRYRSGRFGLQQRIHLGMLIQRGQAGMGHLHPFFHKVLAEELHMVAMFMEVTRCEHG